MYVFLHECRPEVMPAWKGEGVYQKVAERVTQESPLAVGWQRICSYQFLHFLATSSRVAAGAAQDKVASTLLQTIVQVFRF